MPRAFGTDHISTSATRLHDRNKRPLQGLLEKNKWRLFLIGRSAVTIIC